MERLRLVARAGGSVREVALGAAQALSPVAGNPAALLTACRRLVARKPGSGPLVWLAAAPFAPQTQRTPSANRKRSSEPTRHLIASGRRCPQGQWCWLPKVCPIPDRAEGRTFRWWPEGRLLFQSPI